MLGQVFVAVALLMMTTGACSRLDSAQEIPPEVLERALQTNDLERAVVAFAADPTPETEAGIGASLLATRVYLRTDEATVSKHRQNPDLDGQVSVWMVTLPDGRPALAIYTSAEAFRQAFSNEPRTGFIVISGHAALTWAREDQPVALNWGVDPHVLLEPPATKRFLARAEADPNSPRTR